MNHLPSDFLISPSLCFLSQCKAEFACLVFFSELPPLHKPHGHSDNSPRLSASPRPSEPADHLSVGRRSLELPAISRDSRESPGEGTSPLQPLPSHLPCRLGHLGPAESQGHLQRVWFLFNPRPPFFERSPTLSPPPSAHPPPLPQVLIELVLTNLQRPSCGVPCVTSYYLSPQP